jgi:hypothetical protein
MSIFESQTLKCPRCSADNAFDAVYSINADRRHDLRDAVLDDSLQRADCEECGAAFRLDPELTYLSVEDGQWILVEPAANFARWTELETLAQSLFETAYGAQAPEAARAIGQGLKPRIAFGWAALREKLLAVRGGLDDLTLELMKLVLMRGPMGEALADDTELRLVGVGEKDLTLAWLRSANGEVLEVLKVPRDVYDGIAAAPADFEALRAELGAGPFVDVNRLLVEAAEPA